jgi:Fe-S cluster assembly protein SufD
MPAFHIIDIGSNINITIDVIYNSNELDYDHSMTFLLTGDNTHVNVLVTDSGKNERKTNRGFISKIGKDSSLNFSQIQTDGQYVRQRSEFYFTDEGGSLVEIVCLRGHKSQNYDFYSSVNHLTPRCISNTIARGVNDDESTTVFKGKVDIGAKGAKVNTDLSLRGLLLSKKARFHSLPAMEVINNNVIATHGAAVSKIDPEQIFYFETRGIDKEEAEHMIASGYFEPAISKIRSSYLQERARSIISKAVEEQFSN